MDKKYFAFISYKREDEGWAKWFQNELENYHLPSTMNGRTDILKEIPKPFRPPENDFRPIFRDIDELKAGNLPEQIYNALKDSLNLVVICSRKLGDDEKAKWVNKEIEDFIEIGNKEGRDNIKYIFPFIVDGIPHSGNEQECFPRFLRELSKEQERVGGNINEGGDVGEENRERAFVKVLAGMLPDSVSFDMLWNKYDRDKMARERKDKEEKDKLLIAQSRFLAEKANQLVDEGDSYTARLLALEALPKDLEKPDRPYSAEAEMALRKAFSKDDALLHHNGCHIAMFFPNGKKIISASYDGSIIIWDALCGKVIRRLHPKTESVELVQISPKGNLFLTLFSDCIIKVWNTDNGNEQYTVEGNLASFSQNGSYIIVEKRVFHKIDIIDSEKGEIIQSFSYNYNYSYDNDNRYKYRYSLDKSSYTNNYNEIKKKWDYFSNYILALENNQYANCKEGSITNYFTRSQDSKWYVFLKPGDTNLSVLDYKTNSVVFEFKHEECIHSVAFSPDGTKVIYSYGNGFIRIYTLFTYAINSQDDIFAASICPDEKYLALATTYSKIIIWDIQQGRIFKEYNNFRMDIPYSSDYLLLKTNNILCIHSYNTPDVITIKEKQYIEDVTVSNDGLYIVSETQDYINVWDRKNGSLVIKAESPDEIIGGYKIEMNTPEGIRLLDCESGQPVAVFKGHDGKITSIDINKDKTLLASASYDIISIWNVTTKSIKYRIYCPSSEWDKPNVSFSKNGRWIAASGKTNWIYIISSKSGKIIHRLITKTPVEYSYAIFSSNNKEIAFIYDNNTIKICDTKKWKCTKQIKANNIKRLLYTKNNNYLFLISDNGSTIIWDVNSNKKVLSVITSIGADEMIDEGYPILSTDENFLITSLSNNNYSVWDIGKKKEILCYQYDNKLVEISSLSFSPDSKEVAASFDNGGYAVWDINKDERKLYVNSNDNNDDKIGIIYSPDGKYLFTALKDGTIKIWNSSTKIEHKTLKGNKSKVLDISISPDGKKLLSTYQNKTTKIWDIEQGKEINSLFNKRNTNFSFVCWNNTNVITFIERGFVKYCDMSDNTTIKGSKLMNVSAFSPKGDYYLVKNKNTISIRDLKSNIIIQEFHIQDESINAIYLSPNGEYIGAESDEGKIYIWHYPPLQELINIGKKAFSIRRLTTKERKKYYLD